MCIGVATGYTSIGVSSYLLSPRFCRGSFTEALCAWLVADGDSSFFDPINLRFFFLGRGDIIRLKQSLRKGKLSVLNCHPIGVNIKYTTDIRKKLCYGALV